MKPRIQLDKLCKYFLLEQWGKNLTGKIQFRVKSSFTYKKHHGSMYATSQTFKVSEEKKKVLK